MAASSLASRGRQLFEEAGQMGIPTGPQATQGAYGTCALFAMTEVVQEQLQLRYGIVLDVTRARNYLEENMRMHDLDRTPAGASAGRVAKALSGRVSLIPASHDGCRFEICVQTTKHSSFEELVSHVRANRGDSCAYVAISTRRPGHGSHAVAAYNGYTARDGSDVVVCRNSWRAQRHWDVTEANYVSHHTVRVQISTWMPGRRAYRDFTPRDTDRYRASAMARHSNIVVSGAAKASVNGIYHPTSEIHNGKVLFRKVEGMNMCLRFVIYRRSSYWAVSSSPPSEANGKCWVRSIGDATDVDDPADPALVEEGWGVYKDNVPERRAAIVLRTGLRQISLKEGGESRVADMSQSTQDRVFGLYEPTGEQHNGKMLYGKVGDPSTCLRFAIYRGSSYWAVSSSPPSEANGMCWVRSIGDATDVDDPALVTKGWGRFRDNALRLRAAIVVSDVLKRTTAARRGGRQRGGG